MAPLPTDLRKSLDRSVVDARDAAEDACRAALAALGVEAREAPPSLSDEQRQLRVALRAQQRQLGGEFERLVAECAYEQWHLMLFARFLAENDLLIHPELRAPVSLEEVAELARDLGENDPWLLAARFAAGMLPGIFKPADPCVRLPLAPEGRKALEDVLAALPPEVFTADDALGWVYQFWQTKKKKEVNASERKIGGADLAPLTQLFTEDYMVRFLLENSLGAWWAARHPQSPLLADWEYLRYADDGTPAAGRFEGWPETVAEVTVMDPCCGSGHFLVAAFEILRRMREEEEGLTTREAVDAVLRENLYGLELDARCVQLGAFNLALAAWKASGYHELPPLSLACCGIPTRGSLEEWTKLARGDERLERALARMHELFREADTLGSLIDPQRVVEDGTLSSLSFEEVSPLLERALAKDPDPVASVFRDGAREVARAAQLLAAAYTLVVTNVPYLGGGQQTDEMRRFVADYHPASTVDLAFAMTERGLEMCSAGGTIAVVLPETLLFLRSAEVLRRNLLMTRAWHALAVLGPGSFSAVTGEVVQPALLLLGADAHSKASCCVLDVRKSGDAVAKAAALLGCVYSRLDQDQVLHSPGAKVSLGGGRVSSYLSEYGKPIEGLSTGDNARFLRCFWEAGQLGDVWVPIQGAPSVNERLDGCEYVIRWESGRGPLAASRGARIQGQAAWGKRGVLIGRMGAIRATRYLSGQFDKSCVVVLPHEEKNLLPIYAFCTSSAYEVELRSIDRKVGAATAATVQVPFDLEHWQEVAGQQYPQGLPEPETNGPTQWLFAGTVVGSEQPLHVALARLLGFRWPNQDPADCEVLADDDGLVCLPAVSGERPAHERLRELLSLVYGEAMQAKLDELLAAEGCTSLEDWLRDKAFAAHARLFLNRPFLWHIWDGRKDGFAAFVNYHKLNHQTLQKLTYSSLGWWLDKQRAEAGAEVNGAEARVAAALALQKKLELILEGDAPYDIYVRWKARYEQPVGWEPDLDDGVRLNIRPFMTAEVLRSQLPVSWKKDRGRDEDGLERLNDLHYTLLEKRSVGRRG
jgi:hypothetical protein